MDQLPDGTKYVRAISPIKIPLEGRQQAESKITEDERQSLRGHIGSPQNTQYTHPPTWPDSATLKKLLETHTPPPLIMLKIYPPALQQPTAHHFMISSPGPPPRAVLNTEPN